jgi:hypothetical protein
MPDERYGDNMVDAYRDWQREQGVQEDGTFGDRDIGQVDERPLREQWTDAAVNAEDRRLPAPGTEYSHLIEGLGKAGADVARGIGDAVRGEPSRQGPPLPAPPPPGPPPRTQPGPQPGPAQPGPAQPAPQAGSSTALWIVGGLLALGVGVGAAIAIAKAVSTKTEAPRQIKIPEEG